MVAIVGDAGVGKSRLTYEFTHSHRVQDWLILEASSVSYGKATSYSPVIGLLKGYFKIADRDDHREMRAKVLGRVLGLDRALEPLVPPLLALLDVPVEDPTWQNLDPPQRRQRTLDAVKHLLLRESQGQPLLVVFEDLHWIDAETQALLDGLVESLPTARLLLLVNYRPEYQHGWGRKTYYRQLRIDTLPPESADELLAALLGADVALDPLKRLLIDRTQGNPFFLEESVRTLVEAGALSGERGTFRLENPLQTLTVPATAQAILAARIDRLTPEDKRLLQTASVIGKDVPFALLFAVADLDEEDLRRGLAHLQTAELLYERSLFPDLEYTFKHALTHEVTYRTLLQDRRRGLHARLVDVIETLHQDRLGEQLERLAHHAQRGGVWGKAAHYLRQAGLKAVLRSARGDARAWFEHAIGAVEALPQSQSTREQGFEIRLELREALNLLGEIRLAQTPLREAAILADQLNDDHRRARVYAFMTNTHALLGELDDALVTGRRALELAGRLGDAGLRYQTTIYLEQAHYFRGDYEQVVKLATDNLGALSADSEYAHLGTTMSVSVFARFFLVQSLAHLGRFPEAECYAAEALQLAGPAANAFTIGQTHVAMATVYRFKGDWAKARPLSEHGIRVFRTGNIVLDFAMAVATSAWILAHVGESTEALARLREAERLVDGLISKQATHQLVSACLSLGWASLLLGRLDEARDFADRALEYSPLRPGFKPYALHLLGDIATNPDRFHAESGEAHYRQALALAEPRGMRPLAAHCHLGLGKLYRRTDKPGLAQGHLASATAMYRDMGMTYWLEQAEAEIRHFA